MPSSAASKLNSSKLYASKRYGSVSDRKEQQSLAQQAEGWYLCNLLVLPGISFLFLLRLFLRHGNGDRSALATNHIRQTFFMSLLGGGLVSTGCVSLYLLLGNTPNGWMWVIMYFTLVHTSFVLWGLIGLAWAVAKKNIVFPNL
jgi:hypothetical protein